MRVAWCLGTYASRGARAVPVGSASRVLRECAAKVTIVLVSLVRRTGEASPSTA